LFVLVGIVGLIDPPRLSVPAAIQACHTGGIKVRVAYSFVAFLPMVTK
jgi:magnesium-transporting ATPase (P-type)